MIAKDPDERFATAGEMLEHVRKLRQCGPSVCNAPGGFTDLRDISHFGVLAHVQQSLHALINTMQIMVRKILTLVPGSTRHRWMTASASMAFIAISGLLMYQPSMLTKQTVSETDAMKKTSFTFITQASETPAPLHEELLLLAQQALDEYRLTTPIDNNAYYYYRSVLEDDPDNEEAQAGLRRIASIYANLAEKEIDRFHYNKARTYINRGLAIAPDNTRLRALESSNTFSGTSHRVFGKVKSLFQ
jgi:hypothetical protein